MTIPVFPVPDVKPIYFAQGNPGQEALQRAISTLVALGQSQQEMRAQAALEAQKRATADQSGLAIAQALGQAGTQQVPGLPIPGGQTLPFVAKNPLLTSFQDQVKSGVPGRAVLAAANTLSGPISSEVAGIRARRPGRPPEEEYSLSYHGGHLWRLGKRSGEVKDLGKFEDETDKGNMIPLDGWEYPDGRPAFRNNKTGIVSPGPSGLIHQGPVSPGERDAAQSYGPMSTTWKNMKDLGFPVLSKNVLTQIQQVRQTQGTTAMEQWIANSTLTDEEKAAVRGWTNIVRDIVYGQSGKQVTVQEFLAKIADIPTELDGPKTFGVKFKGLQSRVLAQYKRGFRALRSDQEMGLGDYLKPEDLFDANPKPDETNPGISPRRQTPYDLRPAPSVPGAGTVLRP